MTSMSENIFIKIKDAAEKNSILEGIISNKKEIVIKSIEPEGYLFSVEPLSMTRQQLTCQIPKSMQNLKPLKKVIVQFSVEPEKYLAKTSCQINGDIILLDFSVEIFQLQRRENFRLKLPASYKALLNVLSLNSKPLAKPISFKIVDISAGGCRAEIVRTQIELNLNDLLEGQVLLSKKEAISVNFHIRHLADHPEESTRLIAGIQFINLSNISKGRLTSAVMEIYRELFSKI